METASDVIFGRFLGPIICDKRVKLSDPRLNRSREISPETVGGGIFDRFSNGEISDWKLLVTSYLVLQDDTWHIIP